MASLVAGELDAVLEQRAARMLGGGHHACYGGREAVWDGTRAVGDGGEWHGMREGWREKLFSGGVYGVLGFYVRMDCLRDKATGRMAEGKGGCR